MIAILTSTTNGPLDVRWMPCTDTSDLSETLVRLPRQLFGAPSACDTSETVTLGDGNAVNHLILLEDGVNLDWLLEHAVTELDFVCDTTSVDLNLHEVCLLLLERRLADLRVGEDTDDGAVFANALELTCDRGTFVLGVLLGVLCESLLLRLVPVLVESSLELVAEMFSPDRGKGA